MKNMAVKRENEISSTMPLIIKLNRECLGFFFHLFLFFSSRTFSETKQKEKQKERGRERGNTGEEARAEAREMGGRESDTASCGGEKERIESVRRA